MLDTTPSLATDPQSLPGILTAQKASWSAEGPASLESRLDRINRCKQFLLENQDDIVRVTQADWVHKPADFILAAEIIPVLNHAKHIAKNLRRWMKPDYRRADFPFNLVGAKTYVLAQPLGVIGVMVPWNGPLAMVMIAAMDAFSAGNRVMAKISEFAPKTAEFMQQRLADYFDPTELAIVTGELEVSQAFAGLPFDHLMYTGGTQTAKHIMAAAAKNLVPVTLELGGKCPIIISQSIKDLAFAARRTMAGRLINTGQGCITPDYVLITEEQRARFIDLAIEAVKNMYTEAKQGEDYAAIATAAHYQRLLAMLAEAETEGAELITIDIGASQARRQINPVLVIDPPEHLRLLQEEIFGPILVIKTVANLEDALKYINERPRPLALYYFGDSQAEKQKVIHETVSGGAALNDVMMQLMMSALPFGGVGPSGMGSYWGGDSGFRRFSHQKSVFEQGWYNKLSSMLDPPYGDNIKKMLRMQIK